MKDYFFHSWQTDFTQAKVIQETLAKKVLILPLPPAPESIAGFDVSYLKDRNLLIGGMVVMSFPALKIIRTQVKTHSISFPYVPGFLSFREAPVLLDLLTEDLSAIDIFLFDGHGIAHPRGLGIASHIGVWIDRPSIGCAKKKLVGEYDPPGDKRGDQSTLTYKGNVVGSVVRTKSGVKPVFVSIGHRSTLPESTELIVSCCTRYRLPEPLRQAHRLVTAYRKDLEKTTGNELH